MNKTVKKTEFFLFTLLSAALTCNMYKTVQPLYCS